MKKTILFWVVCFAFSSVTCQHIDVKEQSSGEQHKIYAKKRITNNIVGWSIIGAGISMAVLGYTTNISQGWGEDSTNKGVWLIYAGGGTALASLPFFIAASNNKRKARIELKRESVLYENVTRNYAALCVKLEF